jgi:hypothetical protein
VKVTYPIILVMVGAITAIAIAKSGQLITGNPGLLLAVQGKNELDTTALIQVSTAPGSPITQVTSCASTGECINRPGLRIDQLLSREDGKFDIVGAERGMPMYMLYQASIGATVQENYFPIPVPGCVGAPMASAVMDGLVRDPSLEASGGFGPTVLAFGRIDCGASSKHSWLARVELGSINPTWWVARLDSAGGCGDVLVPCSSSSIGLLSSGKVYVITPSGYLARRVVTEPIKNIGRDRLYDAGANIRVQPVNSYISLNYPYIVASAKSGSMPGIARISIDRIFADGAE